MSRKKNDKKIIILEPEFQDILVCRDPQKRPNMEIFVAEPENIFQENLGKIAGVFEIIDDSEDSSYVVNYLISVIKKEYFSKPKRGAIESFEAALHKANLALSKLASHGNVNWIGRLNAVCMVIEKNNLHISQTGTASVLLLRSGILTNISEGGEEAAESNPLKTFQDVLSGRMENNDKIILTTASIFEIFSLDEIKRSALKFSRSDFIQFLNTALINELDRASVLIIDISEREEQELSVPQRSTNVNAFSQAAFQKTVSPEILQKKQEEKREIIEEIKEEFKKTQDGFVDKKTGHIYIKDKDISYESESTKLEYVSFSKDKLMKTGGNFIFAIKNALASLPKKLKFKKLSADTIPEKEKQSEYDGSPIVIREDASQNNINFQEKIIAFSSSTLSFTKKYFLLAKIFIAVKIVAPTLAGFKKIISLATSKIRSKRERTASSVSSPTYPDNQTPYRDRSYLWEKKTGYLETPGKKAGFLTTAKALLPDFSKIKIIAQKLSLSQKIYAAILVAAIVIIPYFIVHLENKSKQKAINVLPEPTQSIILPLEQDAKVTRIENLKSVYQGSDILSQLNINGKNFAIKSNEIVSTDDNKNYPVPDGFINADLITQMDDLNFIFIMKDKKIVSFSATAGKFQDNNISIPDGSNIVSARSYLTYLYLLDAKNNQIYRFPRAEGGFGEKTNWLKENQSLSGMKDMAINDNIYITDGNQIIKFFQGKKQVYSIEQSATPIAFDKIYTKPTSENLYALDKANSRIVKFDKNGKIIAQYYNDEIGNAADLAVDEEANIIYIFNSSDVKNFNMAI
jgi:hypothetical protein